MALENLGLDVDHVFSCDVSGHAKAAIMAHFAPEILFRQPHQEEQQQSADG